MENPVTEDTTVPTTDTPISEVPGAEAGNAETGEKSADASSEKSSDAPATDAMQTSGQSSGTTVDVKQVGEQTVNSNVQNGNQLATGNVLVNETQTFDAPVLAGDTATVTNVENDLNPLVPAAGTEGAPASQLAAAADEPEHEPLPRESHLMLLEAKFSAALAKLRNGERVFLDELDAIYTHVQAVL